MNRLYIDRLRGRLYLLQVYDISKPEIKFKLIYMLIYLFYSNQLKLSARTK